MDELPSMGRTPHAQGSRSDGSSETVRSSIRLRLVDECRAALVDCGRGTANYPSTSPAISDRSHRRYSFGTRPGVLYPARAGTGRLQVAGASLTSRRRFMIGAAIVGAMAGTASVSRAR